MWRDLFGTDRGVLRTSGERWAIRGKTAVVTLRHVWAQSHSARSGLCGCRPCTDQSELVRGPFSRRSDRTCSRWRRRSDHHARRSREFCGNTTHSAATASMPAMSRDRATGGKGVPAVPSTAVTDPAIVATCDRVALIADHRRRGPHRCVTMASPRVVFGFRVSS